MTSFVLGLLRLIGFEEPRNCYPWQRVVRLRLPFRLAVYVAREWRN